MDLDWFFAAFLDKSVKEAVLAVLWLSLLELGPKKDAGDPGWSAERWDWDDLEDGGDGTKTICPWGVVHRGPSKVWFHS